MGDQPTILLVDDDDEVRDGLIEFLRQQGYCIVVGSNEEESIRQATAQDFSIRLILVNQQMSSDKALDVGRRIRDRLLMDTQVPVVVIPLEFNGAMEGKDKVDRGDYKTYLADSQQLVSLLRRLLPTF